MAVTLRAMAVYAEYIKIARSSAILNSIKHICPGTFMADGTGQILTCYMLGHHISNVADATILETIGWQEGLVVDRFVQPSIGTMTGCTVLRLVVRCATVCNCILDNDRI